MEGDCSIKHLAWARLLGAFWIASFEVQVVFVGLGSARFRDLGFGFRV